MKTKYIDLIEQTFEWPQDEFDLSGDNLIFHDLDIMDLIKTYGTPFKITYLPIISQRIERARLMFQLAMTKANYKGTYRYCYCTKSSHFAFVLKEVLKNKAHIETSSANDINIIKQLNKSGDLDKSTFIVCNGYKLPKYIDGIVDLLENGYENIIPVMDNMLEIDGLLEKTKHELNIGIRIASEEAPKFEFYTSRLGIGYKDIVPYYKSKLKGNKQVKLKMLHFFINTGINDTAYYWNELRKCVKVYSDLKKVCPTLTALNIGGGLPIKNSLNFDYDYDYMIEEIVLQIKNMCDEAGVPEPDLFTEFGSYTVGESGATVFKIVNQKRQNDREKWNMINSSFMTTMPDAWAIHKRFILLAINNWNREYERVFLGGLTCDSDDFYNSEVNSNAIYLPKYDDNIDQYVGFFHTGAYQESIGGYGGIQHCLVPAPQHIVIDRNENGEKIIKQFAREQEPQSMLKVLGY